MELNRIGSAGLDTFGELVQLPGDAMCPSFVDGHFQRVLINPRLGDRQSVLISSTEEQSTLSYKLTPPDGARAAVPRPKTATGGEAVISVHGKRKYVVGSVEIHIPAGGRTLRASARAASNQLRMALEELYAWVHPTRQDCRSTRKPFVCWSSIPVIPRYDFTGLGASWQGSSASRST